VALALLTACRILRAGVITLETQPLAPARELLGEMSLELNEPAQALDQFEATLKKEPGRFRALYGAAHAAQLSGNRDTSQRYFRDLIKVCAHADKSGRSELAEAGSQTAASD